VLRFFYASIRAPSRCYDPRMSQPATNQSNAPAKQPAKKKASGAFLLAVAVGAVVLVLAYLAGGLTTRVVVTCVVVTTLAGAWRGALETAAFLFAMLIAAVLAFPIGGLIENPVGDALDLGGIAKRAAAVGVAALASLIVVSLVTSMVAKRLAKNSRLVATIDRPVGGTLGFIEGVFVSFLVLWGALAIQPVANQRLVDNAAARTAGELPPEIDLSERVAGIVVDLADDAAEHPIGAIAASANPMAEAEAIVLAEDYLLIVNDPEAMRAFQESDAMRRVREHPSVTRTVELLKEDPQVRAVIERGLTRQGLYDLLNSDAVLDALNETNVLDEVRPLTADLREALEEARARVRDE